MMIMLGKEICKKNSYVSIISLQWCSVVAMVAHEAAFDAGEVEHMKAPPKNYFSNF